MRRQLPAWAMGLAAAPIGFYYGFISAAMPILLSAHNVGVGEISRVSVIAFSPTFWAFTLCPILDVGFSKRTYAVLFAALAAICLGASTLITTNVPAFTAVLTLGCTFAVLFINAHQGWMPDVISEEHYSHVGATTNIGNLGAAGLFTSVTVLLVRNLSPVAAAVLLALIVMAPTVLLFFIPLPRRRTRGVAETFCTFFRDLYDVCRRPSCIVGLICFLSPTACFALTNLFSALGADFHSPEKAVTAVAGLGVATSCSLGCLAGIWFTGRFHRRNVYILTGFGGAAAALAMTRLPHTLPFFAAGVLTYVFFQGINYTAFSSLSYEIVGPGNPLAGTQIAVLSAAVNVPITYMTAVDGHFHTLYGVTGMLLVDAGCSIAVGTVLLFLLGRLWPRLLRGRSGVGSEIPT